MSSLAGVLPQYVAPQNIGTGAPIPISGQPRVLQYVIVAADFMDEWLMFFNGGVAPVLGAFPVVALNLSKPDGLQNYYSWLPQGISFPSGLSMAVSETLQTFTPTNNPTEYNITLGVVRFP